MSNLINFVFTADTSRVNHALSEVKTGMDNFKESVAKGFAAIGLDSVLSLFGKIKAAIGQLSQMWSSCLSEAALLENIGTRLGVMLDDTASGDTLATSLQRMATNGIIPLQELESAAAALTQSLSDPMEIAEWVGVFADISAGSKLSAARLAEMTARLQDMGKAEFTELANAGIPIFNALAKVTGKTTEEIVKMSQQGKISTSQLLEAFKTLTAEGEKYHALNAKMSNTTGGSWDTLAASFREIMAEIGSTLNNIIRPCLQWVSSILQENKAVIVEIVRSVMVFATIWASIKIAQFAKQLWGCVSALVAMKTTASGLLGIFRAIGKVGWMLVITGAVEALAFLYDKFFGSDGEVKVAQTPPEDFVAKAQEEEKRLSDERQRETLNAAKSAEEFDAALKAGGTPDGYDVEAGRNRAAKLKQEKDEADARNKELEALQNKENNRVQQKRTAQFEQELEAFGKLREWEQKRILSKRAGQLGMRSKFGTPFDAAKMKKWLDAEFETSAENGNSLRWNMLKNLAAYLEEFEKSERQRKTDADKTMLGYQRLREREALADAVWRGDEKEIKKQELTDKAAELAEEFESYGVNKHDARRRAAAIVTKEYNAEILNTPNESRPTREFVTDSMASIGGGGRGYSLGEAQLQTARTQVNLMMESKSILAEINKRMEYIDNGTIKVIP